MGEFCFYTYSFGWFIHARSGELDMFPRGSDLSALSARLFVPLALSCVNFTLPFLFIQFVLVTLVGRLVPLTDRETFGGRAWILNRVTILVDLSCRNIS